MTEKHTDKHCLSIRPISDPTELDLFNRMPYVLNDELASDLEAGRRRTGWLWVALHGDRPLARVGWWGRSGDATPYLMDILDIDGDDHTDIGVRLLQTAIAAVAPAGAQPAEYSRFVPPGWRDDPAGRRAVEDRMAALERTGARLFAERLRLEWRAGTPVPGPTRRLSFRPVDTTDELLDLMTQALDGTLDAHGRRDLSTMPAREAAVRHYEDELSRYRSPREWWRVGVLPDGRPVGFVIPAHNDYNPIIAYLAVLPAYRGNGYIDEIVAEGTRIHAAQGVPRIRAATDLGNIPMAHAFARAGYVNFEREITMTWT